MGYPRLPTTQMAGSEEVRPIDTTRCAEAHCSFVKDVHFALQF